MYIPYEPLFSVLKAFSITRLYNTCFRSVLPYTAKYGFIRQSGNYWTIPAQGRKQTGGIFADFRRFSANMGIYPFLPSDCLKRRNIALYGILCGFAFRHCFQYRQGIPQKYYVNRLPAVYYVDPPTCPLAYYVNSQDPQKNSWLRSICLARSGSGRIPADGSGTL